MTLSHANLRALSLLFCFLTGPGEDEWPRYGHDGALTGRTSLKGDISSPRAAWSFSLAGTFLEIELRPSAGRVSARFETEEPRETAPRSILEPGQSLLDVEGSGRSALVAESHHERWADFLPEVKGIERVAWDKTWTTEKVCHLELFAHDQGRDRPRRVWRSEAEDTVFTPLNVVDDIDGDGVQEVLVALHYRVLVYEGTTGRKETELRFHSSRSYGWFGLEDVDGDGDLELIVLSDFQSHFDVLDYDSKKPEAERLSVKWRREVETAIEERRKWPQVGPRPLADVTGDARPEIALNMFNDTGDGEWHVVILEAATGRPLFDLPRRFTQGNGDLDADGKAEVFCAATDGVLVPTCGRVEVVGFKDGSPRVLWSAEEAGFAAANLPHLGRRWSTTAAEGMRHVLLTEGTERPAFLVKFRDALAAVRHDGKEGFATLWRAEGLDASVQPRAFVEVASSAAALLCVVLPAGKGVALTCEGAAPSLIARDPSRTRGEQPLAVRLAPGGPILAVLEGAAEEIIALAPPRGASGSPDVVWRRPGRGMGDGSRRAGPAAADLDGDGASEVVAAAEEPSGAAALVAYRGDGSLLWRRPFPRTPGGRPIWNAPALTFWWPGRFRHADRDDLFVSTRRGPMHSDVGHLVDGRTGEVLWTREKAAAPGQFSWGYAGSVVAACDIHGDGRDEIVNLYPVCFWIADGATGDFLAARELASRQAIPAWAAYGEPIVFNAGSDGEREVLLDSPYLLALLDRDGKPLWHGKARRDYLKGDPEDNVGETAAARHALADLDGDGRVEVASAGYGDGVRAIDAWTGKVLWSLAAPAPTGPRCAAADIDGIAGDELLYPAGDELVAVSGDRERGRILWRWRGPAALSLPAIADLDGDGKAEVIVQSADGQVHCLDGPPR